jgi:hypothetical protein
MAAQLHCVGMRSHLHFYFLVLLGAQSIAQGWQKLPGPTGAEVNVLEANRHAVAASVNGHGLFLSPNMGQSWNHVGNATLTCASSDTGLVVGASEDTLYVTKNGMSVIRRKLPHSLSHIYAKNGILFSGGYWSGGRMSPDTGQNWYNLSWNFYALAISDSAWYAGEYGLKISRNGGMSWASVPLISNTVAVMAIAYNQSHVWAMSNDLLYHSADHGHNWALQLSGSPGILLKDIAVLRDTVYLTTDYHLLRSANNGLSWDTVRRLPYFNSNSCSLIAAGRDQLLRGGQGIFRLHGDTTWSRGDNGLNYASLWRFKAMEGLLFAITHRDLYYSPDLGITWKLCHPIDTSDAGWHLCHFSHGLLLAADYHKGVFQSSDTGRTWHYLGLYHDSFFTGGLAYEPPNVYCSDSYFTANLANWENVGRVHKTSNGGQTWQVTVIDTLITPYTIPFTELVSSGTALLYARKNLYNTLQGSAWSRCNDTTYYPRNLQYGSGHFYCFSASDLYVSDAQAANWQPLRRFNFGWSAFTVYGSNLCVLSHDTLHYSTNGGLSWGFLPAPPSGVNEITIQPPYLFASIQLNSAWRLPIMTVTGLPEVSSTQLHDLVWPNPASETVQFHQRCTSVKICDLNGRLIVTGNGEPLDLRGLPHGIYVCELIVHDGLQRVKLAVN